MFQCLLVLPVQVAYLLLGPQCIDPEQKPAVEVLWSSFATLVTTLLILAGFLRYASCNDFLPVVSGGILSSNIPCSLTHGWSHLLADPHYALGCNHTRLQLSLCVAGGTGHITVAAAAPAGERGAAGCPCWRPNLTERLPGRCPAGVQLATTAHPAGGQHWWPGHAERLPSCCPAGLQLPSATPPAGAAA